MGEAIKKSDALSYDKTFLESLNRAQLRRALWFMRRQATHPHEVNPGAAQYDRLATASAVRAEYRRRGWQVPKPTKAEKAP